MIKCNMDPNYISGLILADGSFFVSLEKRVKSKHGVRFRPKFSLTLYDDVYGANTLKLVQE